MQGAREGNQVKSRMHFVYVNDQDRSILFLSGSPPQAIERGLVGYHMRVFLFVFLDCGHAEPRSDLLDQEEGQHGVRSQAPVRRHPSLMHQSITQRGWIESRWQIYLEEPAQAVDLVRDLNAVRQRAVFPHEVPQIARLDHINCSSHTKHTASIRQSYELSMHK